VLRFIEGEDGMEWIENFHIRFVNGHTEAMMLPQLTVDDKTLLYCADLLPSMHHLPLPWVMAYDMQPLKTLDEKARLLTEAAAGNWTLFFEHDPVVECASVVSTEKGVRIAETMTLETFVAA
jgi:glyoxylase-like metal-dependent hydrolase (beta-lactamase superfamily II)